MSALTADDLLRIVNAARARARSAAELALVDDADALLVFDRAGAHAETLAAVLRLEEIATRTTTPELTCEVQGSTGRYTLHRTSAVAPWTTCTCPAFVHRRAGVTSCKHLRAANAPAVAAGQPANDATKSPAKAPAKAPADPLARYARAYLPETIELFRPRLLRIERMNEDETVDHRAFARELRVLTNEIESWDRSLRASREIGAGR